MSEMKSLIATFWERLTIVGSNGAAKTGTSRTASEFVSILLKKRLFSSPAAFLNTIDKHLLTLSRQQRAIKADDALLRAAFERMDEEIGDDEALADATEDALATAARTMEPLTAEQRELLSNMRAWAAREAGRPDAGSAMPKRPSRPTRTSIQRTTPRRWRPKRSRVR